MISISGASKSNVSYVLPVTSQQIINITNQSICHWSVVKLRHNKKNLCHQRRSPHNFTNTCGRNMSEQHAVYNKDLIPRPCNTASTWLAINENYISQSVSHQHHRHNICKVLMVQTKLLRLENFWHLASSRAHSVKSHQAINLCHMIICHMFRWPTHGNLIFIWSYEQRSHVHMKLLSHPQDMFVDPTWKKQRRLN